MLEKILGKIKSAQGGGGGGESSSSLVPNDTPWNAAPTKQQMYRYRKQRGVNLGSLFTLETWLTPSLFKGIDGAKSEYDLISQIDGKEAKERLEHHWNSFIDDGDWQWMKEQGIASVRLPISYYHFIPGHPDPNVQAMMKGTEYEFFAPIYQSAFNCIRRTIEKAAQYEIGVLIDLHAAPGGQNSDGHSGLSGGKANFYNSVNMKKTTLILRAIVDTFGQMENVTGLELINEPQDNCKLADWYKEVIKQVHQNTASPNIPLILGDCWNTSKYTSLIVSNNEVAAPVILDHHLYRCFTPGDCHKSAAHHAADIEPGKNGPTDNFLRDSSFKLGKNLIIGEWSAALNPGSFQGQEGHKKELQQAWARAQLSAFNQHCAGHFFWTLKKEGNTDVGWCLYSAIERDILPLGLGRPRQGMDIDKLEERGRQELENNYKGHVDYWNQHAKGKQMHHEFYRDGFAQIYKDCVEFYRWCGDEIGFTSQWVKVRTNSHSQEKGGQGDWEFRDGGNKAIECFLRALWS